MYKNKLKTNSNKKSSLDFRKYTKQIWLAGLGAFSRAEEEGNKLFDSLVQVGEELESKTTEMADLAVEQVSVKVKDSVSETKNQLEKRLDQSISHSLNKIGLVSIKDLHHLEKIVLELSGKVDSLLEENKEIKKLIKEK
ncbi:poly(hydroxyalcanoate) granule associated protein [Acinetobacter sp. Ac_877]|nr:phasin family protein [Acinetobacter portensis]MPW40723.1 poly(hydroxyalcanoate) granule associated protein [Acinetobacter portensis]